MLNLKGWANIFQQWLIFPENLQYFVAVIIGIFIVELAIHIPLIKTVRSIVSQADKSIKIILSNRISDHWKEIILPVYSFRLLKYSLISGVWMGLIFSPLLLVGLLSGYLQVDLKGFLFSLEGGLFLTIVAVSYLSLRKVILAKFRCHE